MTNSKEYSRLYMSKYRKDNSELIKKHQQNWLNKNPNYANNYYRRTRKKRLESIKKYRKNNREKMLFYGKQWREKNRDYSRTDKAKRRKEISYRLLANLRNRINAVLKGLYKSERTLKLIGCNIYFLKQYLSSKFKEGMNWSNYGKWHIDHIKPCASFDLSKPNQQRKCFHYTNLQPLWALENLSKSKRSIK